MACCALAAPVEPERLDFGPFELASPTREARVKLGPDKAPTARPGRAVGMGFDGG